MALEHRIPMNNVNANDNNNGTLFSIEYWQLKLIVQIKVRQVKSNDMLLNWNELNRINFGMFSLSNRAASVRAAILIYKTFKTLYLYRKQLQRRRANLCADLNLIVYEFFNYAKLNWELKSIRHAPWKVHRKKRVTRETSNKWIYYALNVHDIVFDVIDM